MPRRATCGPSHKANGAGVQASAHRLGHGLGHDLAAKAGQIGAHMQVAHPAAPASQARPHARPVAPQPRFEPRFRQRRRLRALRSKRPPAAVQVGQKESTLADTQIGTQTVSVGPVALAPRTRRVAATRPSRRRSPAWNSAASIPMTRANGRLPVRWPAPSSDASRHPSSRQARAEKPGSQWQGQEADALASPKRARAPHRDRRCLGQGCSCRPVEKGAGRTNSNRPVRQRGARPCSLR